MYSIKMILKTRFVAYLVNIASRVVSLKQTSLTSVYQILHSTVVSFSAFCIKLIIDGAKNKQVCRFKSIPVSSMQFL